MRNINANALAEIQTVYGLESILIVRVFWDGTAFDYADKAVPSENVEGKILELSGLEDSVTLKGGSVTTSLTVTLDDTDGTLKDIINYNDVHKRRVQVFQWFGGRPKSDAFMLFDGQINTPMSWNEGQRQFTFTVVSIIENYELGFSFEEGRFPDVPANLIGKAWPMVFGNVLKVPALQITESPTGILAEGFCVVYDEVYEAEINDLLFKSNQAYRLALDYANAATGASYIAGKYIDGFSDDMNPPDNIDTYNQYMGTYTQMMQQANNYVAEWTNLFLEAQRVIRDRDEKKEFERFAVRVASKNFPRGRDVVIELASSRFVVRFDGVQMTIVGEVEILDKLPPQVYLARITDTTTSRRYDSTQKKVKFKWFDGGSKILVIDQPMYYIAAAGDVTINGVFAKTRGITTRIPDSMYTIQKRVFTNTIGNNLVATVVRLNQPLTTLRDANNEQIWEGDDIHCDITSDVVGNWGAIVYWATALYTNLGIDTTSFNQVQAETLGQPMNFCVLDRKNTLDFIKDLCFQARVSVWINDQQLFFRYMPRQPTPIASLTMANVVEDTLVITCDDTENLLTKLIARWLYEYNQPGQNTVITRYNVERYGVREAEYDYFAYNHIDLVRRSLQFWAFRLGTTWKHIQFETFLDQLKIEANDPVEIDGFGGLVTTVPVVGIVESAIYDSATNKIKISMWLPVRWGEMESAIFAYPADVTEIYGDQYLEYYTGNPFQDVKDDGFTVEAKGALSVQMSTYDPNHFPINDNEPTPTDPATTSTALTNTSVRYDRPSTIFRANDEVLYDLKPGPIISLPSTTSGNTDFGTVKGFVKDDKYLVELIGGKTVVVKQGLIHPDYKVVNGTPVVVILKNDVYYMQAPVWANE